MRVVLVSDCHLAGADHPATRDFLGWLAAIEADRLVLLGDVFQAWWHFGDAPAPACRPVAEALCARGIPLCVLPGNHDFHAPAWFARHAGATVGDSLRLALDGRSVHLEHGDGVDRSLAYRALTAALRGPVFARAIGALGPTRGWALIERIAGQPAGRPDPHLIAAQHARARSLGVDVVVMGHTHAPEHTRFPEVEFLNLGDWVTHRTWGVIEDGNVRLEGL